MTNYDYPQTVTIHGVRVRGWVNGTTVKVLNVLSVRDYFFSGDYTHTITPGSTWIYDKKEETDMGVKLPFAKESLSFKEGDTITLEDGTGSKLVRKVFLTEYNKLAIQVVGDEAMSSMRYVKSGFIENGWTVTKVETPVVLPTEDGFYITDYDNPDVFELNGGVWFQGNDVVSEEHVKHDGGNRLQRLYKKSEVVEEVVSWLDTVWSSHAARAVRDQFGDKK